VSDVENFLAHYGVKGMRWGVRKKDDSPKLSRRERLEKAYATKYSDVVAKQKAANRIRTEKVLLTVGAVAVTAAVAVVVGKKLHTEFAPINLSSDTVLQNVNQHGKDFDLNRVTFATYKNSDNAIYREKFAKELLQRAGRPSNDVYATQLKPIKDLKIPSRATAKKLFVEWEKASGLTPKKGQNVITRMVNHNRSSQLSGNSVEDANSFLNFVGKKGFDGIQDFMDQRNPHFSAKTPLMFVNGAHALMVKGAEALDSARLIKELMDDD
jgi:hypothetical protein